MGDKYSWSEDNIPVIDVHSIKKHNVLREYLKQYILVVGANPRSEKMKITFIDGFSGGGIYQKPDGNVCHGSPLIFLEASREAEAELNISKHKGFKLDAHFIFLDKQAQCINFLKNLLEKKGYHNQFNRSIYFYNGVFELHINNIIKHIKKRKGTANRCIFFLDQYGYSDVPLSSIQKIFLTFNKAEVILTFYVDYLIDYLSNTPQCHQVLKKAGLTFDLDQLDDIKKQKKWKSVIQKHLYQNIISKSGARYLTNFFIKSNDSHKSYWLIHLSMHPTARNEMQKLHWKLKNHFSHEGKAGLWMLGYNSGVDGFDQQQDFLFTDIDEKLNHKTLLAEIPPEIPKGGILFEHFVSAQCNFTPSTSEMLNKAIGELYANGELRIFTKNGNLKRPHSLINKDDLIKREPQMLLDLNFKNLF
ncbi:three-Cys-motif partner protein TcmP [Desulfospira joergensenii]|uniref:three-Cys-motif partner protein TcmP n=1 Tax=Desulfospira joergensenii TaxID=53329 RepID=UPI0003B4CAF1|nr:three-Cys-motif partner protein TcmP [Desulfospira joergensenii]